MVRSAASASPAFLVHLRDVPIDGSDPTGGHPLEEVGRDRYSSMALVPLLALVHLGHEQMGVGQPWK